MLPVTGTASVNNTLTAPQTGGTIAKTLVTPAAQFAVNTPVQYQVTAKNTGDVPVAGFTITDPLPAGATFVSASSSGTNPASSFNPATNTVTWSLQHGGGRGGHPDGHRHGDLPVPDLYPRPAGHQHRPPPSGTANGTPVTIGPSSVTNPLQPNSPAATVKKTDTKATVAIGDSDTYTITATNTGNVPISPSFVVTDLIPANLQPDSRPATNVTFTDHPRPDRGQGRRPRLPQPDHQHLRHCHRHLHRHRHLHGVDPHGRRPDPDHLHRLGAGWVRADRHLDPASAAQRGGPDGRPDHERATPSPTVRR